MTISDLLRVAPGAVDLTSVDPEATPGFEGNKKDGKKALDVLATPLAELQTKLFACLLYTSDAADE